MTNVKNDPAKSCAKRSKKEAAAVDDGVLSVGDSVRADFFQLVRIFEQQLADRNLDGCTRTFIADAKSAAERGLNLSDSLLELLRSSRNRD